MEGSLNDMAGGAIRVGDGQGQAFVCAPGDSILAGALRSGLGFPYECNSGGCGSCQFELVEGAVADLWPAAPGISERQRGRGRRLACQSVPLGDCTVKVALDPGSVPPVLPAAVRAVFESRRQLTADMAEFAFRSEGPAGFRPGQYAMLRFEGLGSARAYSMCNLANPAGEWRFIVKRMAGGAATALLFDDLRPGDRLMLDGPFGKAWLRTGNGRDIVCIAGGSGLSPVMSILRGAAASPDLAGRRLMLFHGGRGPADLCAAAMLDAEPDLRGRVELHVAISDTNAPGAGQWQGARGMIHELVRAQLGDRMADFDYYFCGPPPMTDAVHRMLLIEAKVPAQQLHFDRFY